MARACGWLVVGVMIVGGCSSSQRPGNESWDTTNPPWLLQSAIQAGESEDRTRIAELVSALDHDDPAVRMMSIHALQRITGTRMGYHPYGSAVHRQAAIGRWRQAVASGRFVEGEAEGGQAAVPSVGQGR